MNRNPHEPILHNLDKTHTEGTKGASDDGGAGVFQGALDEAKKIMADATAASVDMAKTQANNQIQKKGGENAERSAP